MNCCAPAVFVDASLSRCYQATDEFVYTRLPVRPRSNRRSNHHRCTLPANEKIFTLNTEAVAKIALGALAMLVVKARFLVSFFPRTVD
jgi:hypothetical protein